MVNLRRTTYNNNTTNAENNQSLSTTLFSLLKAFPFLLTLFIFITWVSLRFHTSFHFSSQFSLKFSRENDLNANLVRFLPIDLNKDKRGWMFDPVSLAIHSGLSGGALTCASVHVGEIRPGGMRGNHRHYTCNETFILWGARIRFRLENSQVVEKGYVETIIEADEVAVATSPSGTAHAIMNVDRVRIAYLLGCQDSIVNYNSSSNAYKIWNDL